ncbi:molecular chaperone TorD [Neisseria chenwenguii]|uniref:Molecular chaperone TorD n=2 Tax=Neisseria chenwenguii TaxID=1853278 RepID=A0A220S4R8_9NEIS|nr:molecular chaperone TorD [Neisseria chenwenguii]
MLDIARHYYSPQVVKQYIDTVAQSGGKFVHLHFSDNENYALESAVLNQRAKDAVFSDGIYTNPLTKRPFWSDEQLKDVVEHAKQKNIELIPEFGGPRHIKGVFDLLAEYKGKTYARELRSAQEDDEINITKPESVAFVKAMMGEIAAKFPYGRRFHIGGDEFGYSAESNHEFVRYANDMAAFLEKKGLKTQMWNDGMMKSNLGDWNKNIEITYWSYDGDPQSKTERRRRRAMRASLPDLVKRGFKVWNYNSYYLYFVPKQNLAFSEDIDYATRDVRKNWHLGVWDRYNFKNTADPAKIQGAAYAVWGEHAGKLSDRTIYAHTKGMLEAVMHKAGGKADWPSKTAKQGKTGNLLKTADKVRGR